MKIAVLFDEIWITISTQGLSHRLMVNLMSLKAFTSLRRIVKCSICVSTFYQISIDSFNTTLFIDSYLLLKSFTLIFLFDFFLRWLSKDRHLASNFLKHLNLSWSALRDLRRLRFIVTIPYPEKKNDILTHALKI